MIRIQPSYVSGGGVPEIRGYAPITTTGAFLRGAPLAFTSGQVDEHGGGATVTGILGISLCSAAAGLPAFPAISGKKVPVAIATADTVFLGQMIGSAALKTDLSGILAGAQYGLLKSTYWYVDFDDTTHVVLEIVDVDDSINCVWFKFLASAIAETV